MREILIAGAMVLACSSAALADSVGIEVDNFFVETGISTAVLKITNNSSATIANVFVSCAFLGADKKAIDVGKAWVTDLRPGQTRYENARIASSAGVQYARCSRD